LVAFQVGHFALTALSQPVMEELLFVVRHRESLGYATGTESQVEGFLFDKGGQFGGRHHRRLADSLLCKNTGFCRKFGHDDVSLRHNHKP